MKTKKQRPPDTTGTKKRCIYCGTVNESYVDANQNRVWECQCGNMNWQPISWQRNRR